MGLWSVRTTLATGETKSEATRGRYEAQRIAKSASKEEGVTETTTRYAGYFGSYDTARYRRGRRVDL